MQDLSETGATGDSTGYGGEVGGKIIERMDEMLCDFLGRMWRGAKA